MKVKKLLLGVVISVTAALPLTAALADPPAEPPGQGECEHGNSGQTCVPDPQPTHGQDCEEHGPNEGGVNEDHCLSETVTTTSPPTETTTTTTTVPSTTTSASDSPGLTETPSQSPSTSPVTLEPTSTESSPTRSQSSSQKQLKNTSNVSKGTAFTGVEDIVPLGLMALGLMTAGSGLFWLGTRRKREDT